MIDIITICDSFENGNTYIVGNEQEVIVIDPANKISSITSAIKSRKVLGVFLTHAHYDHFKTLDAFLKKYNVNLYIHKNGVNKLTDINSSCAFFFSVNSLNNINTENIVYVKDNEVINLNSITVKVITTPGHTNCSVVYQIEDSMFTGDTLFNDGVGRTDLPTSNTVQLINSLKKLLDNNEQKIIYPGHGNPSTLDEERKYNDFYRRTR